MTVRLKNYDAESGVITQQAVFTDVVGLIRELNGSRSNTVILSCDMWDVHEVVDKWLPAISDRVKSGDKRILIHPDRDPDPVVTLCGNESHSPSSRTWAGVLYLLYDHFGGTFNEDKLTVFRHGLGVALPALPSGEVARLAVEMGRRGWAPENLFWMGG